MPVQTRIDLGELQFMLAALGVPVNPKVDLCSGVAKATDHPLTSQTLWSMMEQIDTMPPYGSFGLEEWIEYNLLRRSMGDSSKLMSAEWAVRVSARNPHPLASPGCSVMYHPQCVFPALSPRAHNRQK